MTTPNEDQNQAPKPGSDEYNQAMADKFRSAKDTSQYPDLEDQEDKGDEGTQETKTEVKIPEGIPAKFIRADGTVDVEGLAKSYAELERQRSQGEKPKEGGEAPKGEADDAAKAAAEQAGLDFKTMMDKVSVNGDIEDGDYAALEKAGIPKDYVKEYIDLRKEKAAATQAEALEYGGGVEAMTDLLNWASQNLSLQEIETYNEMLASSRWKVALDTIKTLRGQAAPQSKEPKLVTAKGQVGGSNTGYVNRDEMYADMADPLYREKGPKGDQFRQTVARKTAMAAWRNS